MFGVLDFTIAIFVILALAKYIGIKPKGIPMILAGAFLHILAVTSTWLGAIPLTGATALGAKAASAWLSFIFSLIAWILILFGVILAVTYFLMGKEITLK